MPLYKIYKAKASRKRKYKRKKYKKYKKKRYSKRKKKSVGYKLKKHSRAIRNLQIKTNAGQGKYIDREYTSGFIGAEQNQLGWFDLVNISETGFEALSNKLPFFNPSAPNTLIDANLALTTFSNELLVTRSQMTVTLMNNYEIPAHVSVYLLTIKTDTSRDPTAVITADLVDIGKNQDGTALAITSQLIYPSDCPTLVLLYKIKKIASYWHMPGRIKSFSANSYNIKHNYASFDQHMLTFSRKVKSKFLLFRTEGPPAHDSVVESVVGTSKCRVDFIARRVNEVHYNAGQDIERLNIDNGLDSFVNTAQTVSKPPASFENWRQTS